MAARELIRIDEAKCDGCGLCVSACAEGAIAIVDGKARLVSETYCDGLGACLGHCPQGAISIERVEAAPFDEAAVARRLAQLRDEPGQRAVAARPPSPLPSLASAHGHGGGCPGSQTLSFTQVVTPQPTAGEHVPSALRQWPVQLHLVSPTAPYFERADVLLAADCVAYALGDFHQRHLAGRALAIACPKLDVRQEVYLDKLVTMIDHAGIASLTVMVMEVPCCSGLARLAQMAVARATRPVPLQVVTVGIRGDILDSQKANTFRS